MNSLTFVFYLQMLPSKDVNFVGYTYKNYEIVNNDNDMPSVGLCFTLRIRIA
jgi:serine/threonine kinase 38